MELLRQYLPMLIPLVVIDLGLRLFALFDLMHQERVRGLPKWGWALVVLLVGFVGPISYFVLGREV